MLMQMLLAIVIAVRSEGGGSGSDFRDQWFVVTWSCSRRSNFLQALAYSAMLCACNKPETMTTRLAPAAIACVRFSDLIPPMQKMGMETRSWTLRICARPMGE